MRRKQNLLDDQELNDVDEQLIQTPEPVEMRKMAMSEDSTPTPVPETELENINEQATSETLKTKEQSRDEILKDLINKYREESQRKIGKKEGDDFMNALTGIGQAANVLNRMYGTRQTPDVEYWGSRGAAQEKLKQQQNLKNILQEYNMAKGLSKPKDAQDLAGKIYQTKSGLVQLDENLKPTEIYRDPTVQKRVDISEQSLGLRGRKQDFQEEKAGRLSDKEVKDITAFDEGTRILDQIDTLLQSTDVEKDLGPYASRFESLKDFIPGTEGPDEDFVKVQQLVGIQLADYVKSISGAQVSEQEAQRLLKNIPNMSDKPRAFKTKLDQFKKELNEAKEKYLDNIGKQKKSAEKFKQKRSAEKVRVRLPNGKVGRIDGSKLEAFQKKYPNAEILD